jgi:pilus assembly protein CpaF
MKLVFSRSSAPAPSAVVPVSAPATPPREARRSSEVEALLARFADPAVDELLVNGTRSLGVVRQGCVTTEPSPFRDPWTLLCAIQDFAVEQGVRLDPLCPSAGGAFADHGYRWHALLPPLSPEGALLALRRHRFRELGLAAFDASPVTRTALVDAMKTRRNLLIAGPTGSGKTSLLAALLTATALQERVVVVESLEELPLASAAWIRLLERRANLEGAGRVDLRHLVREALRLRPDRVVVGEIRGEEAAPFLEAGLSGHGGLIATIHAGSVAQALARLRLLSGRGSRGFQTLLNELTQVLGVVVMERGRPPRIVDLAAAREWNDG